MVRSFTLLATGLLLLSRPGLAHAEKTPEQLLAEAEPRLKSIYVAREFAAKAFPGTWLADSTGYVMLQAARPGAAPELIKFDVKTGERSVLIGSDRLVVPEKKDPLFIERFFQVHQADLFYLQTRTGHWLMDLKSGELKKLPDEVPSLAAASAFSPQADRIVFQRGRNLAMCEIASGRVTLLTSESNRGEAFIGNPSWSPDGKRVAFLQSDYAQVRQRAFLVPTDPTTPRSHGPTSPGLVRPSQRSEWAWSMRRGGRRSG